MPCDMCEIVHELKDETPNCEKCWYYIHIVSAEPETIDEDEDNAREWAQDFID